MSRPYVVGLILLGVAVAVIIGVVGYNAGLDQGLSETTRVVETTDGETVRVVADRFGPRFGFFPFGFLLFPLFFFGVFALLGGLWRRRWMGPGPGGPAMFEEWHRRAHERERQGGSGATGEPAGR